MAYYNPYINWVVFHPLYNPTNQGFFHCSNGFSKIQDSRAGKGERDRLGGAMACSTARIRFPKYQR